MTTVVEQAPAAGSAADPSLRSYFAYHGAWAPGVRLFRRLGFRVKAAIVAGVLVTPLLLMVLWQASQQAQGHDWSLVAAVAAASLLPGGYLLWCFYLVMEGGLRETERHLIAMTNGDLTTSPAPWGRDEAARLMRALAAMQDALRGMVLRVRESSQEIVHSASEIASGALDLQARTEQTSANLEQSASAMEEVSSTVRNGADNVSQAASLARGNAEVAQQGGAAMNQVVATMEDIHTASSRIADIIGTVDSIAFQTNILALNAAVEAARAGDQGRGFAVVASEVRLLAGRSTTAAREIKDLIAASVTRVESGASVVRDAGDTIGQIVSNAATVNRLLGEIATGTREQALGVEQIGRSVTELDHVTQQNAALVEQTAAAASAMKDQARTLAEEVARFRLPAGLALERAQAAVSVADFNFDKAIEAHRQWKVTLRRAIEEQQQLDADTLCKDDRCPLGQWLHGPGGTRWGSKPSFRELMTRHAEFHVAAGDVARKINARNYADAERLIGSGSRFAHVSTEVSTLLTKAKRGL